MVAVRRGLNPSVKELLKNAWLALALGDQPGHDLAEGAR